MSEELQDDLLELSTANHHDGAEPAQRTAKVGSFIVIFSVVRGGNLVVSWLPGIPDGTDRIAEHYIAARAAYCASQGVVPVGDDIWCGPRRGVGTASAHGRPHELIEHSPSSERAQV